MKPSSVLKYSGWGIVDSPSESPRQTADFFLISEPVSILFQGSYVYGHNNHGQAVAVACYYVSKKVGVFMTRDPTKCKILLSPDAKKDRTRPSYSKHR